MCRFLKFFFLKWKVCFIDSRDTALRVREVMTVFHCFASSFCCCQSAGILTPNINTWLQFFLLFCHFIPFLNVCNWTESGGGGGKAPYLNKINRDRGHSCFTLEIGRIHVFLNLFNRRYSKYFVSSRPYHFDLFPIFFISLLLCREFTCFVFCFIQSVAAIRKKKRI